MQRCKYCATRVAADATRCWLCHAGVEPTSVEEGPDDLAFLPHPAHVWTGPLARAPMVHASPGSRRRRAFSLRRGEGPLFSGEFKLAIMLLAVLAAALPYAATGSRTALLLFAAPLGMVTLWAVRHALRRDRVARFGHRRGIAVH